MAGGYRRSEPHRLVFCIFGALRRQKRFHVWGREQNIKWNVVEQKSLLADQSLENQKGIGTNWNV